VGARLALLINLRAAAGHEPMKPTQPSKMAINLKNGLDSSIAVEDAGPCANVKAGVKHLLA
jgi:hypothetical protein